MDAVRLILHQENLWFYNTRPDRRHTVTGYGAGSSPALMKISLIAACLMLISSANAAPAVPTLEQLL